jgi:sigma-B regulation protein RsbU (phosphoserine phosphatase)
MADSSKAPDLLLELTSQPRLLAPARAMVGAFAQRLGFNEIHSGQISLALDEALCNVINHGYERRPDGWIRLKVWDLGTDPPGIGIELEDRAKQVDPLTIQPRDLDEIRPGGLGVYIIREIMDEAVYEHRDEGGMRLRMTKQIPAASECAPARIPTTGHGGGEEND